MAHDHSHNHGHQHTQIQGKNLLISIILNIGITLAQILGGLISGSLALLSDALHNFTDVLSLIISYFANWLSKREASPYKTFGYKRAEIIAAFVNASTLMVISILLIVEAIKRFYNPQQIGSDLVIILSIVAILGNGFSVLLLKKDARANMNMRSAYLHLFTDLMASVAVLVGGLLMKYFEIYWVDSLLTLLIALYLIYMGWDLLKASTRVLMLFTPKNIPVEEMVRKVCTIDQVKNIHHIHIWQLNEDEVHLEAHMDFEKDLKVTEFDLVLEEVKELMFHSYGINHVTIQPEFGKADSKEMIVQD